MLAQDIRSKFVRKILQLLHVKSWLFDIYQTVGVVGEDIAISAASLGFDSPAHSVADGLPPLRRFFGAVSQALNPWDGLRHSLHASA